MALELPEILNRSAQPRCRHFGECGGCSLQDVPYEEQVAVKSKTVSEFLDRDVIVVPSPEPYGYRHRMDYITAFGKIGLRKKGDAKTVVNLEECHIVQPRVGELLQQILAWMQEFDIKWYDPYRHFGDLRYITTRHAISSDELMIIVVTGAEETATAPLCEKIAESVESVVWVVQPRKGDDSHGDVKRIYGAPVIHQQIGRCTFEIGPNCFFQNNLLLIDEMFEEIGRNVDGRVLDLYCGVGTIGICVSDKAKDVTGVEVVPENIQAALCNIELNRVENIRIIEDNANHWLAFNEERFDTLIVDPPRDGLAPKVIHKINRLEAERMVYVSCNPKTFVRDLELLEEYELADVKGFDMFPQTPHLELVSHLRHK